MPKFRDTTTWQQAEVIMQPAFIRLVDHLRKQIDASDWQGTYEEVQVWAEGVSEVDKARVIQLWTQLETASPEESAMIEQNLIALPSPYPGYHLSLSRGTEVVSIDLWQLCYQICFQDYDAATGTSPALNATDPPGVHIDANLFDETGELDWDCLDHKVQQLVEQLFANLPKYTD